MWIDNPQLDNYCISRGTNHYAYIMSVFKDKMTLLEVFIAAETTEGPKTRICFLSLEIDSEELFIRIPVSKIQEII